MNWYCVKHLGLFLLALNFLSCKSVKKPISSEKPKEAQALRIDLQSPLTEKEREQMVKIATRALGHGRFKVQDQVFSDDAFSFIKALYKSIGRDFGFPSDYDSIKGLFYFIKKQGRIRMEHPKPGDVVFFHNTFDQSRNGRMNDALTHIGIVEKIDGSIVSFIHFQVRSVIRSKMDLSRGTLTHDPASRKRINHILRRAQGEERAYTAAELFAGYGSL